MTCEKFESVIGYHCSPVLMGLKPSNLVSFSKEKMPGLLETAEKYTEELNKRGIHIEVICSCRKHFLLLVYRPDMLEKYLSQKEVKNLLKEDGYPENASLEEMFGILKKRFKEMTEFPHEIGLFLGYPIEDVVGFRKNKGSGCKMCGYWKVYGDIENAKRQFTMFDDSRAFITRQIQKGYSLIQILSMNQKQQEVL